jgi:hypothetical protein
MRNENNTYSTYNRDLYLPPVHLCDRFNLADMDSSLLIKSLLDPFRNVSSELQRGDFFGKHLINLLQCPILCLGNKEETKSRSSKTPNKPKPSVLPTPVEICRIDKIGRCEENNPTEKRLERSCEPNREGSQTLSRNF